MIPGITNSGIDTQSLIDQIMDAQRAPVERMERQIDRFEDERAAWQELGRKISNLQEASRLLFSFETPFLERIASSSDPSSLTATANRNAQLGVASVDVRQLASADRFISRNLATDFQVPAGRYGFRVGEQETFFTFQGGQLRSFAQTINQRAGDIVSARVVQNTASTQVILIEALRTGSDNRLDLLEDARSFGLEAGILEEVRDQTISAPIQASTVSAVRAGTPAATRLVQNGTVTVLPGGDASIRLPAAVDVTPNLVMEFDISVLNRYEGWAPPTPPPGPETPDPGSVTLGDVRILNEPSTVPIPPWEQPEPPVVRDDLDALFLRSGTQEIPLSRINDTDGFVTQRLRLADYVDRIDGLAIVNNNTHREIALRNVVIYDESVRGDTAPANPIATARDAILLFEGIEVIRPTNTIDDLVDGVAFTLRAVSTRPVDVTVDPDREAITDGLIAFVFYYNELMREINILTRSDRVVVDEIATFTDQEREAAIERLGMLRGDLTLSRLRSSMQTVMMNPYPTDAGNELSLLAQMGVSTNAAGAGGGIDAGRLRGYLEVNPRELETRLQTHLMPMRQLFGSDSDGDRVIDTGVAVMLERNLRPYTQVGGIIAARTGSIAASITQTRGRIDREEIRLSSAEAQYRASFARMEGALGQMQESRQRLQALQVQTGNN